MNSTFHAIKECIDASAATARAARAARYRRLMLSAEKMFCVAALSHDQDVIQACLSVAAVLREEAETIDFPQACIDREANEAEDAAKPFRIWRGGQ